MAADCTDSVLAVSDRPDTSQNGNAHTSPSGAVSGWFPDPLRRYEHRWFNGVSWTADVSVDGQRFVDPLPLSSPPAQVQPPGWATPQGYSGPGFGTLPAGMVPRQPSRTLAVLALIAGLVAVATGWMPIFFVGGAIAGIAAITLGAVARSRIRDGRARGSGMALAGLILGPIGLGLCVVGVMLTAVLLREVRDFTEPGPTDVEITSCEVDGPAVRIRGTIENLDAVPHDYSIVLEVYDATQTRSNREVIDRDNVEVRDVDADEVRTWELLMLTRGSTPTEARCEFYAVNGPFPFGLDPNP
jgi:hypothetical protein